MSQRFSWVSQGRTVTLCAAAMTLSACNFQGTIPDGDGGDAAGDDTVLVVFRNLSSTDAVQVDFHAASGITNVPDDLFVSENLITQDIGVAGTGIVQPLQFDFLREFPCTGDLLLGTSGGRFLDNETGELRGTGQPRWVEASAVGFCGGAVTFTFVSDGEEFRTEVSIAH